jgi:2-succinyl-5-enolpyruvyl-6-hydroxy-3-cyclohexene-1-carboxylate synthase
MNTLKVENATYACVTAFVDELVRAGVKNVVVCPGSRSTPLAYGFAGNDEMKVWMHYDERSAGFFALGMAKASGKPVALVCTSGTAAANFMPAVVEAKMSRVPLIVLTADRPAELRDNGAPQAIDQLRLYGSYAKWFIEMALPEATNEMLRYVRTVAGRAAGTAAASPAGVVHLNMPFREPLTPAPIAGQFLPPEDDRDPVAWYGRPNGQPYVSLQSGVRVFKREQIEELAKRLTKIERGIIIAGPDENSVYLEYLTDLASVLGYPVLADPLSAMRCGNTHDRHVVISNYDAFLRDEKFTVGRDFEPEVIIRFGAMPTAKPLLLFMKRFPNVPQIVVDGGDGWNEPTLLASEVLHGDAEALSSNLIFWLLNSKFKRSNKEWFQSWRQIADDTAEALRKKMDSLDVPFEGQILASMAELLTENATLYVGNSMPIRDLDSFFAGTRKDMTIFGNRGANGIDGLVSSALGAATVRENVVLVLGDVSFYHDLNGLLAAKLHKLNATIVVLNNDGGGIFSFLPQAGVKEPDAFEQLFGTPHGLDFEPTVKMYGGDFVRPADYAEFKTAMQKAQQTQGLKVIEVVTNRASNVTLHRQMWAAVYEKLGQSASLKEKVAP